MFEEITDIEEIFLQELDSVLEKEDIKKENYSFESGSDEYKVYLTKENKKWQVYIIENGQKVALSKFNSIEEALKLFVASITLDNEKIKRICEYMLYDFDIPVTKPTKKK